MKRLTIGSTFMAIVALCLATPACHADDDGKVMEPRERITDRYSQSPSAKNSDFSSATISASSWSTIDPYGRVTSRSNVGGSAKGNASIFGRANGSATATIQRSGRDQKSNASSSAKLRMDGKKSKYGSASNEATSTASVTKNGIQITRSARADEHGTETLLDVVTRSEKISVRERDGGPIEVRVQSRKADAGEEVFSAANREELKKANPRLVRRIEAFEKIVGPVTAKVGNASGGAEGIANGPMPAMFNEKDFAPAERMLRAQIKKMIEQNGDNPAVQELLRKQLQDF